MVDDFGFSIGYVGMNPGQGVFNGDRMKQSPEGVLQNGKFGSFQFLANRIYKTRTHTEYLIGMVDFPFRFVDRKFRPELHHTCRSISEAAKSRSWSFFFSVAWTLSR